MVHLPWAVSVSANPDQHRLSLARTGPAGSATIALPRALALVVLVVALIALAWSDAMHGAALRLLEASKAIIAGHAIAGPLVFIAIAAVSAMLAFFSSAILVPAAVVAWGPVPSALLLWAGWMLGGLASYGVARRLGRPVLHRLAPWRSLAPYEQRIARDTPFGVVLLFQLALPSEIPGYVLGLMQYPLRRYLLALAIAELPYAVGTMRSAVRSGTALIVVRCQAALAGGFARRCGGA